MMSKKQAVDKAEIRHLSRVFEKRGVVVRREKLSRGSAFRVKSGNCLFSGDKILFVDRRLSEEQQLVVLIDHLASLDFDLTDDEIQGLSPNSRVLLEASR